MADDLTVEMDGDGWGWVVNSDPEGRWVHVTAVGVPVHSASGWVPGAGRSRLGYSPGALVLLEGDEVLPAVHPLSTGVPTTPPFTLIWGETTVEVAAPNNETRRVPAAGNKRKRRGPSKPAQPAG